MQVYNQALLSAFIYEGNKFFSQLFQRLIIFVFLACSSDLHVLIASHFENACDVTAFMFSKVETWALKVGQIMLAYTVEERNGVKAIVYLCFCAVAFFFCFVLFCFLFLFFCFLFCFCFIYNIMNVWTF